MQDGTGINVPKDKINFARIVYILRAYNERLPNRSFWYKILKTFAKINKDTESSFGNTPESLQISKIVDLLGGFAFFKVF